MPYALLGSLENNEAVSRQTYCIVAVNLFSVAGAPLNLNPDAPDKIPLWYFDEALG